MPKVNYLRNLGISLFAILLTIYGVGYFIPLKGDWVDRAVSGMVSRRLEFPARCMNTQVIRWSLISFERMEVAAESNDGLFQSGPGNISFLAPSFFLIHLTEVRFFPGNSATGLLRSLPVSKSFQGEWVIERLTAGWSGNRAEGFLHLLECASKDFELRGGVKWAGGRVLKVHFYCSLAPEKSKNLPKDIYRRMIPEKRHWVAFRVVYNQNQLTLIGLKGPLFQAKWSG